MTTTRAVADFTGTRGSKQGEYGLSGILVGMSETSGNLVVLQRRMGMVTNFNGTYYRHCRCGRPFRMAS